MVAKFVFEPPAPSSAARLMVPMFVASPATFDSQRKVARETKMGYECGLTNMSVCATVLAAFPSAARTTSRVLSSMRFTSSSAVMFPLLESMSETRRFFAIVMSGRVMTWSFLWPWYSPRHDHPGARPELRGGVVREEVRVAAEAALVGVVRREHAHRADLVLVEDLRDLALGQEHVVRRVSDPRVPERPAVHAGHEA